MATLKFKLTAILICCSLLGLISLAPLSLRHEGLQQSGWALAIALFLSIVLALSVYEFLKIEHRRVDKIKLDLATSNLRLREIIDNAPQPITIRDLEGNMLMANAGALKAYGLSPESVVGVPESRVANEAIVEGVYALAAEAVESNEPREKMFEYSVDGVKVAWSVVRFPIRDIDGNVVGTGGIATDITELFEAERRAAQASKDAHQAILAAESARHQADLSKQAAEKATLAKNEFLSRMSHELRTPMNAILGFAQLMEMQSPTSSQKESIGHILNGGKHLLSLINEVLELSRIETGNFSTSLEPIAIQEVVAEVADLVNPMATKAHIRIRKDVEESSRVAVRADRQRLRQVLINLLSNAVKYNEEGGEASVSTSDGIDTVRIEVRDTGPGIPEQKRNLLFTPFERLGAETKAIEGTGLGLALSKHLVEAMHGEIGYLPNPSGKGSLFWIELPRAELPSITGMTSGDSDMSGLGAHEFESKAILYIEDNLSNVTLMEQVVKGFTKLTLTVAANGKEGLRLLADRDFDLVLLDLHLPDMLGSEVLLRIKGSPNLRSIPVIVVSADATQRQIDSLLEIGAHTYLTKPFEIPRLLESIRSATSTGNSYLS